MSNIGKLKGIVSRMKIEKSPKLFQTLSQYGNTGMFNYATNGKYNQDDLENKQASVWNRLQKEEIDNYYIRLPLNGFEEMIRLTEEGKLWKYPIDNEQGMDAEKQVPFEEHVFLDRFLDEFPKNDYIQDFMELALAGLAKNPWITVERKHEIIRFYKEYFEEKRESYKEAGLDI